MKAIINKTLNVTFNVLGQACLLFAIYLVFEADVLDDVINGVTAFGVLAIAFFMKSKQIFSFPILHNIKNIKNLLINLLIIF